MHYPTARGQWAVELLQCTVPLPGGSGQWNSCNALSQRLPPGSGTVDCRSCNAHCPHAWDSALHEALPTAPGQWAVHCMSPNCLGAVGSGTPAMHCPTAQGGSGQ